MQVTVSSNNFIFPCLTASFHKIDLKTFKGIISGLHLTTFVNILPKLRYLEGRNYIQIGYKSYSVPLFSRQTYERCGHPGFLERGRSQKRGPMTPLTNYVLHYILHLFQYLSTIYLKVAMVSLNWRGLDCGNQTILGEKLVRDGGGGNTIQGLFSSYLHFFQVMLMSRIHSLHWGINPPPQKHHPLFLAKLPLNRPTVQSPLFRQSPPPLYWFFVNPHKSRIFQ